MKKIIKQVLGIDVAQKELVVCLGKMFDDSTVELFARKKFANTLAGFKALLKWIATLADKNIKIHYVMEATGVYHESFAYFLDGSVLHVSIILPNKISNYMRTLDIKTITDKTAADAICQFGLERQLEEWHAPNKLYKTMRQLTRERDQIIAERTVLKNQLHAEISEAEPNKRSVKRIEERIKLMDKHADQVMEELEKCVCSDKELSDNVKLLKSIPGIGLLTACIILSETNNFDLIRNKKQLTSYAGLDVKDKESGTSVKGKSCISKRGNKYLRKSMHLPALSAIRHSERYKAIFSRLVSKHGIKMKASVAVQRKLLELSYTIIKTRKLFNPIYFQNYSKQNDIEEIRKEQTTLNPPLYSLIKIDLAQK